MPESPTTAAGPAGSTFIKGFIPGLVIGLLVGLAVGAFVLPLLDRQPELTPVGGTHRSPTVRDRDERLPPETPAAPAKTDDPKPGDPNDPTKPKPPAPGSPPPAGGAAAPK